MSDVILKVENLSKQYRLGLVGTGSLGHDLNRFWHRIRGKEDPYLKIGAENDRSAKATSDYVWALQDINFEVKRGEIIGIIGKNGAGKSTLLKILSRVTAPTTGSIKTKGRIASLLEVGTGMHPELTGRENIFLNGAILGMTKAEIASKIDEIVDFSGCEMYIDTPVKRYSSGMRVRLGFAVAAFLEPDILVVDEVLAVGDAEFQKKAIGKMQDISDTSGRTVLFVSHNMAAVKSLCTRGIALQNGKIAFRGTTDDCVSFYLNENDEGVVSNARKYGEDKVSTIDGTKLIEAKVIAVNKPGGLPIAMDDSIEFTVEIQVVDVSKYYYINAQFFEKNKEVIFACTSQFEENVSADNTTGRIRFMMKIPPNFFNSTIFTLDFQVYNEEKEVLFREQQVIEFNVIPKNIELGRWFGKSKGPLRPDFEWNLEKIKN
ncbi:ABC transporter ATP-binding protein [Nonlabens xiamenensis]|uniref:ABC transporter ATP-binding protein n=1 Tax=Nonlabens xiamenensis TaxID=2341043 RepID=UPI000F604912|nr:ABC transporter ATP-binding protein [Nonlabens xiamenensis]